MSIPTPPTDQSGGFFVVRISSTRGTHRMRFHVDVFNADNANMAYTAPAAGQEPDVLTTVGNVVAAIKPAYNNAWTFTLDSIWQSVPAAPAQSLPQFTQFAPQTGTAASASNILESFVCFSFRTVRGGRARFFLIDSNAWSYGAKAVLTAAQAPGWEGGLITEMTSANTAVRGHDGSKLVQPSTVTYGLNKRLRRKAGNV